MRGVTACSIADMYPSVGFSPDEKPKRIRVVANLPYYITKDVLRQMLPMSDRISHLHFMLQVSDWEKNKYALYMTTCNCIAMIKV